MCWEIRRAFVFTSAQAPRPRQVWAVLLRLIQTRQQTHSQIQVPSSRVTTAHSSPSQAAAQPPRVHSLEAGPRGGVGAGGLDSEWTGAPACTCPLPVQVKGESGSSRNPVGQNLRVQYLAPRCLPWERGARIEACWSGHRGPNRAQRLVQTSLVPLKLSRSDRGGTEQKDTL